MSKSFNVVIATSGRPSLQRMVDSIAPQLSERDYLTIIWDCQPIDLQIDSKCQVIGIHNAEPLGYWGHGSRTRWQNELPGDYLLNADDDDMYTDNAMEIIREYCKENKLYVFQFIANGFVIPRENKIAIANIGTPCGVYPATGDLPAWPLEYGGDCDFYLELSTKLETDFISKIIYAVNGRFEHYKKETPPENNICSCGGKMTGISIGGVASLICLSCRKQIDL